MKRKLGDQWIELLRGDITAQNDLEAIVNAANAQLMIGGGVAGAIHRAAGPGLEEECRPLAPIAPGEAVLSSGHQLPNPYVIHCLGPVYGQDEPSDRLLADCYKNALILAQEKGIASVGFPAISTGAFGYPMEDAAHVALHTLKEMLEELDSPIFVRFVLFGQQDLDVHIHVMQELFPVE